MRLSNELVYSGALQCGNNSVATARLHLPDKTRLQVQEIPTRNCEHVSSGLPPRRSRDGADSTLISVLVLCSGLRTLTAEKLSCNVNVSALARLSALLCVLRETDVVVY